MKKLNNKGSAIVTVLVVTTFITIIGTTMLYISSQNYQQKQTNYQNKKSFYGAEEALDCLKAFLVDDAGDAYSVAYQDLMQNYARIETDAERRDYYQKAYTQRLLDIWDDRKGSNDLIDTVQSFMVSALMESGKSEEDAKEIAECIYNVESYGISTDGSQFVFKGVRSKYSAGNYTTFLYTDICIEVPSYNSSIPTKVISSGGEEDGEEGAESDDETSTDSGDEIIALTDYVVYMNWRRADYEDVETSGLEVKDRGTPSETTPAADAE